VSRRGRPRKTRPTRGTDITPGMALRDVAAATGVKRSRLELALRVTSIPADEFERVVESSDFGAIRQLELLARRHAGKSTKPREHRCPNCAHIIRVEKP